MNLNPKRQVPATAITTSPAVGLFAEAALSFNQLCTVTPNP